MTPALTLKTIIESRSRNYTRKKKHKTRGTNLRVVAWITPTWTLVFACRSDIALIAHAKRVVERITLAMVRANVAGATFYNAQ
jgi:hypothetical protein